MFIYLSKKIAIPNNVRLRSLSWNGDQGWIACGGEGGMLKVLKLDSGGTSERQKGLAAPSNLSMNQTLEGHNGSVMCVTWNENYRKLTTSDQGGLIIVWMLHKGMWYEEMINNRNVSTVREMKWARDGQRICIAYEDGHVIVGSVDGNRLWGKELGIELCFLEWSPDGRNLLFGTLDHKVNIYDSAGNYISKVSLRTDDKLPLIGLEWYDVTQGLTEQGQPSLAIGFANGLLQLMRSEADESPILVDTAMAAAKIRWNTTGTLIVVAGTHASTSSQGERREIAMIQFFSPYGDHLRTLKVPGSSVASLSFEGRSLRIAIAVDSFIYFANIRPAYKWAFFESTVVCHYPKYDRSDSAVLFANTKTGERVSKFVKKLVHIASSPHSCALVSHSAEGSAPFHVMLCNAAGSPVDTKHIDITPKLVALTDYHFVACSAEQVYVWQYRTLTAKLTSVAAAGSSLRRREGREQAFHIDDLEAGVGGAAAEGAAHGLERDMLKLPTSRPTDDPIIAVCATERALFVARESGSLLRCSLPHVGLEAKYALRVRPHSMSVNCDGTRIAIIDANGVLTLHSLERQPGGEWGEQLAFERKDVWDFKWAADDAELFALMEKTRMHIVHKLEAEEPVLSSAYLCAFSELEVTAVLLDELIAEPEHGASELVLSFDSKALREGKQAIGSAPLGEALAHVEAHPHPKLWKLLAEAALAARDLGMCEQCFVQTADYLGLQFVRRLKLLDDPGLLAAEVHAYYARYDEAEAAYLEMDRRDLALDLRARLGDWARVVQLAEQGGGGGDDSVLQGALSSLGDYYAERLSHARAVPNYAQSKNAQGLIGCYYALEDYAGLEKLIHALPDSSPLLKEIGDRFASVGMAEQAVIALGKAGEVGAALKVCVELNQWAAAVQLAEEHQQLLPEVERVLSQYARRLLDEKRSMMAIDLYRKAGHATEAASLLSQLARADAAAHAPPLRVKKLYVLAALQVESFRKKALDTTLTRGTNTTAQTLTGLMKDDDAAKFDKALDSPWRGAEAYHFLLLAQRQLYAGQVDEAMRTAQRLREYEQVLDAAEIYSLVALTAFHAKFYGQCSRALIKLEALPLPAEQHEAYEQLALAIFTRFTPEDPAVRRLSCSKCDASVNDWSAQAPIRLVRRPASTTPRFAACGECGTHFQACIASGRAIIGEARETWKCKTCKHRAFAHEMNGRASCPLCHAAVIDPSKQAAAALKRRPLADGRDSLDQF